MEQAYIYDAVRTPRTPGKKTGELHEVRPIELGATLFHEIEARHDLDTAYVDDVMMGCTTAVAEQGCCIGKSIVMQAGWDESIPGVQMDRYCASGLEAVNSAAQNVMSGWNNMIIAGGVESMSRVPMMSNGGALMMDPQFVTDHTAVPQGISADLLATLSGYSRDDVDEYALESQQLAATAQDNGYFDRSVVPVKDGAGIVIADKDTHIKRDTSAQKLASLDAAFTEMGAMGIDDHVLQDYPELERINHVHTPGNSSGIVDGASAVMVGSGKAGKDLGIEPRGRILAGAVVATDPTVMFYGPAPATRKCLDIAGLEPKDIDLWELNEAFASVVLRYMDDMDLERGQINVNGGAIALGHPLGATGAVLVSTVLDELERRREKRALVTLCAAGGMGIATIIERV